MGGGQAADGLPQCLALPGMAGFAVQRAVEAVEGVGQRHVAGGHVGEGFRLLARPGVEGLAGGVGVVALAGAPQVVLQGARAGAAGGGAGHRRQAPRAPPQAEAEQGGQAEQSGGQLPRPQGDLDCPRRARHHGCGLHHQCRVLLHLQGVGRQTAAHQAVLDGAPPHHFQRRQLDAPGGGRHQGAAFLATADQAVLALAVAQPRLLRITAQPGLLDARFEQWQLRAGQPLGADQQAAGQRIADLQLVRRRAPVLAQVQHPGRQPGRAGRVVGWLGLHLQGQRRRAHLHRPPAARPERLLAGRLRIEGGGAEQQGGNRQLAALLGKQRIARFDHAVAHAADQGLVGTLRAQRLHAGLGDFQRTQAAVVVQRQRVVDAQGEDGLGLYVDAVLIELGVDEDRCQALRGSDRSGFADLQGDGRRARLADLQRGNLQLPGHARLQADDQPAVQVARLAVITLAGQQAGVEDFELLLEGRQVGAAEQHRVVALQGQLDDFAHGQFAAVDPRPQFGGLAGEAGDQQGEACRQAEQGAQPAAGGQGGDRGVHGRAHRGSSCRCCCSYQNLRRSSSAGSSGIWRSHCSRAWRCSPRSGGGAASGSAGVWRGASVLGACSSPAPAVGSLAGMLAAGVSCAGGPSSRRLSLGVWAGC
ncbi:hypothetical protein D3C78_794070 [compost metagenome]